MQVNTALLSWYSPVRDGPKYSKCLLCNVVHIGVVSRIAGSPPALILQSIPEHMFAQRDMLRHTPPEMASTHLVCPNGPTVDFECVTGVYCLPPPEPVAQDARTRLSLAGTFSFPLDGGSPTSAAGWTKCFPAGRAVCRWRAGWAFVIVAGRNDRGEYG
ncbi:hypothetical protein BN946_scf185043.g35 [Trametes cinnabarina]|uniref:Uncharacterized protein n=1 Tax=Pycnoporus cinnabarinus TaxID=5643 RepID=A0A060SIG9_PYCCI|nr:hypothetical protein BN946_scf185043.g35 [Trametes cinnabarina]